MKTAIVTGGSKGIGYAVAEKLKKSGYNVVIAYFSDDETAKKTEEELGVVAVKCDVSKMKDVEKLFDEAHKKFGKVSVLVNSAGIALCQKFFADVTDEEYERVFAVNVKGSFNTMKRAIDDMLYLGGGVIVNVSSVWGIDGGSCEAVYSATKGAINACTKSIAKELCDSNIRVNAVAPGFIDTAMNAHLGKAACDEFFKGLMIKRAGTPEEVAKAVTYLIENEYVTGEILRVDGGIA